MKHTKQMWICFRAFLLTVALCLGPSVLAQAPPASNPSPPDPVIPAVVQLLAIGPGQRGENRECSATGFFVNEEGYILTNAHVVEEGQRCLARTPGARILAKLSGPGSTTATAVSCDVVALDDLHDLAVIKTERPLGIDTTGDQKRFVYLDPSNVDADTPVTVTGHPSFVWQPLTQRGKVIRRDALRLSERLAEASEVIVVNIPLRPGNSGSPVYLEAGKGVIGVVERQDPMRPTHTVAVPIRYAIELLNRHSVRWHASPR